MRTVVLTVSTSVSRREAEDASGPLLAHLADDASLTAAERKKLEAWIAEVERKETKRAAR